MGWNIPATIQPLYGLEHPRIHPVRKDWDLNHRPTHTVVMYREPASVHDRPPSRLSPNGCDPSSGAPQCSRGQLALPQSKLYVEPVTIGSGYSVVVSLGKSPSVGFAALPVDPLGNSRLDHPSAFR